MAWDVNLTNKKALVKSGNTNVRSLPGTTSSIVSNVMGSGTLMGITTGALVKQTDGDWYQIILPDSKTYGYVRNDVTTLVANDAKVDESQAKNMIDQMVSNDVELFKSLARIATLIKNAKAKNKDVSKYESQFETLKTSYSQRQNKIKNSTLLKFQEGIPKGYEDSVKNFLATQKYMAENSPIPIMGIGAIQIVGVVLLVLLGAGLATAAYFTFKPDYTKGAADLKVSKELELALSKVDPATATKIKEDLGNQIDTAYNKGKTDEKFGSLFSLAKYALLGVAGFFAIKAVIGRKKNEKK